MSKSGSPEIFSPSDLRRFASEICAGESEIFVELIGDCQRDIDYQLKKLREARETASWKDVSRAAHSIKSAARTFGSPLLKSVAFELEQATASSISADQEPEVDAKTEELTSVCDTFKKKLQEAADNPESFLS